MAAAVLAVAASSAILQAVAHETQIERLVNGLSPPDGPFVLRIRRTPTPLPHARFAQVAVHATIPVE